jgi:surface antigen
MEDTMTDSRLKQWVLILLCIFALSACATPDGGPGPKAAIGGIGGATVGGLLAGVAGGNAAGIAAGTILGGLIGGAVGDRMDAADRRWASQTATHALETSPSGTSVAWQNPDSGHYGEVTPTRTYQMPSGQYCREYQQTITIDGQPHQSYGTACRQPDGSWKIIN